MDKFIFIDIDGTIIKDNLSIDYSILETINKLPSSLKIIFATGRPRNGTLHLFQNVKKDFDIISLNGAGLTIRTNKELISKSFCISNPINFKELWKNSKYTIVGFSDNSFYANQLNDHVAKESEILCLKPQILTSSSFLATKFQKFTLIGEQTELLKFKEKIKKLNLNCEFSKLGYLEVTESNVNKGFGIKNYFRLINKNIKDVITLSIGDSDNDQKMFDMCNYSFFVGRNTKIVSDFVTYKSNIFGASRVLKMLSDLLAN